MQISTDLQNEQNGTTRNKKEEVIIQISKTMNVSNNKAKAFDLSPTLNIFQQKQE